MNPTSPVQETVAQVKCPTCGTFNRAQDKFCISCGAALAQSEAAKPMPGAQPAQPPLVDLPDDVPAEVVALVNSQVLEVQGRLLDRMDLLDTQIADLQMDQVRARKPWWREMPVLISLGALLFTISATVFNYVQARQQNAHNSRIELRSIIQRLAELPKDNIDAFRTYTDSFQIAQVSSLLQEENALLAKHAVDVMNDIPDYVNSSEYLLVAQALINSSLYDDALRTLNKAVGVIKDSNDGATVYRFQGQLLFNSGDLVGGRQAFQRAVDIFDKYPTTNIYYKTTMTVQNEVGWSSAEYSISQCGEAKKHIEKAQAALDSLNSVQKGLGFTQQLQSQVTQMAFSINACAGP